MRYTKCMDLRTWREQSEYSAKQVADIVGVAYSTWICYENGSRRPKATVAEKIESLTKGELSAAVLMGLSEHRTTAGLRETGQTFEAAPVTVAVPTDLADMARKYGLDIEALISEGGVPRLREAFKAAYIERHKVAINEINASVREHGTLSQRFGMI